MTEDTIRDDEDRPYVAPVAKPAGRAPHPLSILLCVAAVAGFVFAAVATYDFVAHLDRQVHGLHCSFLPGLDAPDVSGSSGCHTTLMSPYSSVLRTSVWGGIPIALPAMSVFAFLAFWVLYLVIGGRQRDRRATLFLLLATLLPVIASAVMGYLSLVTLGTACKLCVGIYISSGVAFFAAVGLTVRARGGLRPVASDLSAGMLAAAFGIGVVFVALPAIGYASRAPDFDTFVGSCGQLPDLDDPGGVLVPVGPPVPGVPVLEVLDPLCPACRGFEQRFEGVEAAAQTSRRVLLFPLDDECNWMIGDAIHPGACAISEAVLCAESDADEVLDWAFEQQEEILTASRADASAAARMARERFPALASCIGSPAARARLNLALRWSVDHALPVITPQLYVGQTRLCDADTDLGLDYMLTRLVARSENAPAPPPARPLGGDAAPTPRRRSTAPRSVRVDAPPPSAAPPSVPVRSAEPEAEPEEEPEAEPEAEPDAEPEAEPAPDPVNVPVGGVL